MLDVATAHARVRFGVVEVSNVIGNSREHRTSIGSVKVFEHGTLERADFSRVSRIDRWWI